MANEFSYDKGVNTIPTGSDDGFASYDGSLMSTDGVPIPARSQMGYKTGEKKISAGISCRNSNRIILKGYMYNKGINYIPDYIPENMKEMQSINQFRDAITIPVYRELYTGAIVRDLILVTISLDGKRVSSYGIMNLSEIMGERKNAGWNLTNEINWFNAPTGRTFEKFLGYSVNQYIGTIYYGNPTFAVKYNEDNNFMFVGAIEGAEGSMLLSRTDIPIDLDFEGTVSSLKVFMFPLGLSNDFIGVISNTGTSSAGVPNYFKVFINQNIVFRTPAANVSTHAYYFGQCFMHPTYISNQLGIYIEAALLSSYDHVVKQKVVLHITYPGPTVRVVSNASTGDNINYYPVGSIAKSNTNVTTFLAKVKKNSDKTLTVIVERFKENSIYPDLSREALLTNNTSGYSFKSIDTVVSYKNNKKVYMYLHLIYSSTVMQKLIVIDINANTSAELIDGIRDAKFYDYSDLTDFHVFSDLLSRG
jgi:hypothetical protein